MLCKFVVTGTILIVISGVSILHLQANNQLVVPVHVVTTCNSTVVAVMWGTKYRLKTVG